MNAHRSAYTYFDCADPDSRVDRPVSVAAKKTRGKHKLRIRILNGLFGWTEKYQRTRRGVNHSFHQTHPPLLKTKNLPNHVRPRRFVRKPPCYSSTYCSSMVLPWD
jgi:hypothetical protein